MGFTIKDILHNKAKTLLHLETQAGLGCTEPAAIGLCAAAAASLLKERKIDSIDVTMDPNIYKNAMGVIIPASNGQAGIPLASAMGAVAGEPGNRLEIFLTVDGPALAAAEKLVGDGKVKASIREGKPPGLYIRTVIKSGGHTAEAVVEGHHDNISSVKLDGKARKLEASGSAGSDEEYDTDELGRWLNSMSLADIVDLLDSLDSDDVAYIRQGIGLNMKLVQYGLTNGPGLGVGKTQQSLLRQGLLRNDMVVAGGMFAAAGIDSRMGGAMLPAMTLAGSGNQGISASTPIRAVADYATLEDDLILVKAVTLSDLITINIKTHAGRLGPMCGSAVAGGGGVAAGVAYLLGGNLEKIGGAICNHLENTAMLICDGAKTSCALKVGAAAGAAVQAALLALHGTIVQPTDGFIDTTPEATMAHVGKLTQKGLASMDPAILEIMLHKCP